MALIITPGQLSQRGELYHALGTMLAAGLPVTKAVEHLQRNPPARSLKLPLAQLQACLAEGRPVAESMAKIHGWLPPFDLALIEAGERSGRLDQCFKLLSNYYQERAQLARQVISDLLYPLGLLHFAVLIFTFIDWFSTGRIFHNLAVIVLVLGPLYGVTGFLLIAGQGRRGIFWRTKIENFARRIPILGAARRALALARLSAALEALINAGVLITNAWDMAVAASGSPALVRVVATWKEPLENGMTPAQLVSQSSEFPELFSGLYNSGEVSGQLDDTLRRLHALYQEEATRKMRAVSVWTPRLIYWVIMVLIGWKIVASFYGIYGPGGEIDKASKF